jgi:hypothetical protein
MWMRPDPREVPGFHEALVSHLRHEIHGRCVPVTERASIRRWVGHQLVRMGTRLAADPTMRPVRSP